MKDARKKTRTALTHVSRREEIPASFIQEEYYLEQIASPENRSLNNINFHRITGCKDASLLRDIIEFNIKKHEIFRTYFSLGEERVNQNIIPERDFVLDLELVDWTEINQNQQDKKLQDVFNQLGYLPFDLDRPPLIRCKLFKVSPTTLIFFLAAHHSIIDMSTRQMLFKDISDQYDARTLGSAIKSPDRIFQYADYSVWERASLTDEFLKQQIDFWKNLFSNPPELINLPLDFHRPAKLGQHFKSITLALSSDLWRKAKELAKSESVSLFQVNLAIFSLFMHSYTGDSDFCIGSAIDLRRARGLPTLMGPLINDIVFRSRLQPELTYSEFIKATAVHAVNVYKNSNIFYEKISKVLKLKRYANGNSLYQVVFSVYPDDKLFEHSQLKFERILGDGGCGEMDIVARIDEQENEILVTFRYNADLFLSESVDQMLQSYLLVFEKVLANPKARITELTAIRGTKKPILKDQLELPADTLSKNSTSEALIGETEISIGKAWKRILNLTFLGRNDDFFILGGGLMDLVRLHRLLKSQNYDLKFHELYANPTVSKLSAFIIEKNKSSKKAA